MIRSLVILLAVTALPARAQPAELPVGTCDPATAEAFLDIGNVRAKILNNGGLFWNGGENIYEIPKGSGIQAIFDTNLWIGGQVDGQLRVAKSNYGPFEFWPGPLEDAHRPPTDCSAYDRIWMLERANSDYRPTLTDSSTAAIRMQIDEWPVDLGAPYDERSGMPGYQPADGDVPLMRGDQTAFWVMNDSGNEHEASGSPPLGIEVRGEAFAFAGPLLAGNNTFYRYTIINRSGASIDSVFVAFATDTDFGYPYDDVVGTDTTLGLVYTYNADDDDETRGWAGYGEAPPAIGYTIIERSLSSEPKPDSDVTDGELRFDYSMMYYDGGRQGSPYTGAESYAFMQGHWRDGTRLKAGSDNGYHGDEPTDFFFPGDPVEGEYWSGMNYDGEGSVFPGREIRMMGAHGPMRLAADDTLRITFAVVWARGNDHLDSVRQLRELAAAVREYSDVYLRLRPAEFPDVSAEPGHFDLAAGVWPNPASESANIRFSVPRTMDVDIRLYDALGREVAVIQEGVLPAGDILRKIDVATLPAGAYMLRMQFDSRAFTRTLVVR